MKSTFFSIFLIFTLVLISVRSSTSAVDYNNQLGWDGSCQNGTQQSPIDINTKATQFCPNLTNKLKFECTATAFTNGSGQAYTITSTGTGYVGINDQTGTTPAIRLYKQAQYHFHAPSQHTLNGKQYPLQIHHFHLPLSNAQGTNTTLTSQFVNFNTSGYSNTGLYAAVVGYMFYPSDQAHAIDLNVRTDANGIAQINGLELFGCTASRFFYHYRGSATSPPCGETVDWFVYREPLPLKTSNYNAIKQLINEGHSNARSTQPLNGRKVYLVGDACSSA